ncbi:MAG: metal ABC transporter solute-binding protein, Zn/Mn family [Planctomycetota bacterium]|jgi:manganese/zinc/iron transport system substrate-binding protein
MRALICLPIVATVLALLGCERAETAAARAAGPYQVTTTTGMITDVVRQVAGEQADVTGIMREGVDPHLYKPTRADVVRLTEADAIFYNGLMLEGKMVDVLVRIAREGKPVHAVTEGLADDYVLSDELEHHDPHVWMDVRGWMRAVESIGRALVELDPAGESGYRANAAGLLEQLDRLDAYARSTIASIPARQRVLVTAHDAFSYFGRAYGIEVRAIQGISTESEAGVRDINDLVDFIVDRGIGAVFVETSVADKNVQALIEGARARGHEVRIGGSLFSDAMGPSGSWEGTYVGMIDHNVTTIARALGGSAPAGGFREWLDAAASASTTD